MSGTQLPHAQATGHRIATAFSTLVNDLKTTLDVVTRKIDPHTVTDLRARMLGEAVSLTSQPNQATHTAGVLARAIYTDGSKLVAAGHSATEINRGIEVAVSNIVADLGQQSRPARGRTDIARIGTISANGESSIGEMLAEAMEKVGWPGAVLIQEAGSTETTLDVLEGMRLPIPEQMNNQSRPQALMEELVGAVAIVRIGAATEAERREKKARAEGALFAVRAAIEEGIVPGGGVALVRARASLAGLRYRDDRRYGVNIVRRALEEPLRQLASLAGVAGSIVVDEVKEGQGAFGFNAATAGYEDLIAAGVIELTKVVRAALQNAATVASLMLMTQALAAAMLKTPRQTIR